MTYAKMVKDLENRGVIPTEIPSLEPLKKALKHSKLLPLIDPQKNIVVAGTNGKGSVCATLSALLTHSKVRVGLYTSPHLVSLTERFRIQDQDINEDLLLKAYQEVLPLIEEFNLSHFESLTLMAAWIFFSGKSSPAVDYAIWEVGMGGLWDASNAIDHHFCGITKLGLDHQFFLGNDLQAIANQKFGIISPKAQVVFSPMDKNLESLRDEKSKELNCQWYELPHYELEGINHLKTIWGEVQINMFGYRAAENTIHALKLFELMGFNPKDHLDALTKVHWPGRFSLSHWPNLKCPLYLSGDHNAQGVESLLEILNNFKWKKIHIIVGIGIDKDAEYILQKLDSLPRSLLYLTETSLKPLALEDYPSFYKKKSLLQDKSLFNLLTQITLMAQEEDLVLITGSLYLIGHFLNLKAELCHD